MVEPATHNCLVGSSILSWTTKNIKNAVQLKTMEKIMKKNGEDEILMQQLRVWALQSLEENGPNQTKNESNSKSFRDFSEGYVDGYSDGFFEGQNVKTSSHVTVASLVFFIIGLTVGNWLL